jgi:hypothetical protein
MKGKLSVFLHLAALIVAAVCAFLVFDAGKKKEIKGTVILDASAEDLKLLAFEAGRKKVEAAPREGGGFTLTITEQIRKPSREIKKDVGEAAEKKAAPAVDGGVPDGEAGEETAPPRPEPPPMTTETKVTSYRASQEFDKTLGRLLPLVAERELGKLTAEKQTKFGLDKSERTLTVQTRGHEVVYAVGNASYGGATTYIRQQPGGPTYLISSSLLRSIDIRPSRFLERRLVGHPKKDVTRIAVKTLTAERELLVQGEGREAKWVAADDPETVNALYGNWVNNVFRLGAEEYLAEKSVPAMQAVATIRYFKDDEELDRVELTFAEAEGDKKDYYARSRHTGAWVRLRRSDAETVSADLSTIVPGE